MTTDYSDELDAVAKGPKAVTVDGTSATAQDADTIIKIEDRAAAKTARARNHLGLVFRKIQPGGGGL
jgi:hypothetical protein